MGRNKIMIKPITDERNKQVTLNKRKLGLMKKAYELSVLCGCEIALIIFDSHDRNYIYGSHGVGDTLKRYMGAGEPIESHTNVTMSRLLNEKGKKSLGAGGAALGAASGFARSAPSQAAQMLLEPVIKLPSFTPGTEAKMRDIEEKYATYTRQLRTVASTNSSIPSQSSTDSLGASGGGSKARDHGLRVHIPGTSKAFPPGTAPRVAAAKSAAVVGSPSGGSYFALSSLGSIPTPSTLLPTSAAAAGFLPSLATPSLPMDSLSPSFFGLSTLPTPSILNLTAQSPGVINHTGAGDLHVSNTAMQAHQHVAQMFANASAAAGTHSESDSSDEEGEEGEGGSFEFHTEAEAMEPGFVAAESAAAAALHEMSSAAAQKRSAEAVDPDVATKRSRGEST